MKDPFRRPSLGSAVLYADPKAALDWLERAFGFERSMVVSDATGLIVHAEMTFGDGYIMLGSPWNEATATPGTVQGRNTQTVHVHLEDGIDAHCVRAQAAGAVIVRPLSDEFYGDRVYGARDPEGHVWTFGQTIKKVTREEAEAASGLRIEGWG